MLAAGDEDGIGIDFLQQLLPELVHVFFVPDRAYAGAVHCFLRVRRHTGGLLI